MGLSRELSGLNLNEIIVVAGDNWKSISSALVSRNWARRTRLGQSFSSRTTLRLRRARVLGKTGSSQCQQLILREYLGRCHRLDVELRQPVQHFKALDFVEAPPFLLPNCRF